MFLSQKRYRHWLHLLGVPVNLLQGEHEAVAVPDLWLTV
jgi:hypothetical protein